MIGLPKVASEWSITKGVQGVVYYQRWPRSSLSQVAREWSINIGGQGVVSHQGWPRSGLSLEMANEWSLIGDGQGVVSCQRWPMIGLSLKVANEWSTIRGSSHKAFVAPCLTLTSSWNVRGCLGKSKESLQIMLPSFDDRSHRLPMFKGKNNGQRFFFSGCTQNKHLHSLTQPSNSSTFRSFHKSPFFKQ